MDVTLTTALAALGGLLALAVVALGLALARARRGRREAERRMSAAVADLNARMESMVRELSGALARTERESARSRMLAELAVSLDLEDVLTRTLEAAARAVSTDAALALLPDAADGKPLVVTLGLSADEARREGVVSGPPDGRPARSIAISYRYTLSQLEREQALLHAGLAVPLPVGGEHPGTLAVFTRELGRTFTDAAVRELEELAQRAGPAIRNARRFAEARQLAELDALTGLHNRRFFHETLERECERAHRYGRELALVVLDVDDFKEVNDRIGHLAGDAVLAEVARRIGAVTRAADVACRVGGDEFAVVLPESTLDDAHGLYERLQAAVSARPIGDAPRLLLSAGLAALQPGDDARTLFQRADAALYRAKDAGKAQLVVA